MDDDDSDYAGGVSPSAGPMGVGARSATDPSLLLQPGGTGWSQVSSRSPSTSERLSGAVQGLLEHLGLHRSVAAPIGDRFGSTFDLTPMGAAEDAGYMAGSGNKSGAALAALGAIPGAGLEDEAATALGKRLRSVAYGTHEMAPGKTTLHLPDIANGTQQVRDAYSDLPGGWWKGPDGRDVLYDAQGAKVHPTNDSVGIFDDEFNRGQAAPVTVGHSGPRGQRVVDPASSQMMSGTEAFRAYMDAQDAGAWSHSIPGQNMSHNNGFELPPGAQSRDDVGSIIANTANTPFMPNVVNQGQGRNILANFVDDRPPGISTQEKKTVQGAFPGAKPIKVDGDYIDYAPHWAQGEGSDAATNAMLDHLTPEQEAAFSTPHVKAAVLAKFDRDAAVAASTGQPVRADLQYARKLFADGGMPALRGALGKGLLPAAAVGAFLPYAFNTMGRKAPRADDGT